jgi:hypothetical protein
MAEEVNANQIKISIFVAIAAFITVSGGLMAYTAKLEQMEAKSENCLSMSEQNKQSVNELQGKVQQRQMEYVEIKTKLEGIEASLVDIKKSLK